MPTQEIELIKNQFVSRLSPKKISSPVVMQTIEKSVNS